MVRQEGCSCACLCALHWEHMCSAAISCRACENSSGCDECNLDREKIVSSPISDEVRGSQIAHSQQEGGTLAKVLVSRPADRKQRALEKRCRALAASRGHIRHVKASAMGRQPGEYRLDWLAGFA